MRLLNILFLLLLAQVGMPLAETGTTRTVACSKDPADRGPRADNWARPSGYSDSPISKHLKGHRTHPGQIELDGLIPS